MSKGDTTATWIRWAMPLIAAASGTIAGFALKEALAARADAAAVQVATVELNAETREYAAQLAKETMKAAIEEARYEVDQHRKLEEAPQTKQIEDLRIEVVKFRDATVKLQGEVAAGRRERHRARAIP